MGGVGIASKTSPRQAAIEKVQAELRQEYDVREKRKRELEFLEEGGNPLDFKHLNAALVSVQSTTFTEQYPDQFVISEAKGSFAFNASPHGDSLESSGRLGAHPEPKSADNIILFDGDLEFIEGDRNLLHPRRSYLPYEKSSQMEGSHRIQDPGNSVASGPPRKAYKRRYRSRPNRDGTRSSSTDVNPTRASHGSSLPSRHIPREVKGLIYDSENIPYNCNNSGPTSLIDDTLHKTTLMGSQQDMEVDGEKNSESTKDLNEGVPVEAASDAIASETPLDDQCNQQSNSEAVKAPTQMDSYGHEAVQEMKEITCADIECPPNVTPSKVENRTNSCWMNGFSGKKGDGMKNDGHNNSASHGLKGLDSESSCSQTSLIIDRNKDNDSKMYTKKRNVGSNGKIENQISVPDETPVVEGHELVKGIEGVGSSTLVNLESASACQSQQENGCNLHHVEELNRSGSALKNDVKDQLVIQEMEACGSTRSGSGRKPANTLGENPAPQNDDPFCVRHQDPVDVSTSDLPDGGSLTRVSTVSFEARTSSSSDSKLSKKVDEDSILKEAQIIEAKRRRIAELSFASTPKHFHPKSHWDYVLEEVAWLANDFAQERGWKIAAAAHICSRAAFTYRLRKQETNSVLMVKEVAHTLAKFVMDFWHSVQETSDVLEQQTQRDGTLSIQAYAVRFLKYNNSNVVHDKAEVPPTPDRVCDMGIFDLSWEDNLTEENLFYTVPAGAMETYKNSIQSHVDKCERIGSGIQEEVETSAYGVAADSEPQDNAYYEDEGETNMYDMSMAFDGSNSTIADKKRRHLMHAYGARLYEVSPDIMQMQCAENNVVTQQSALLAKRPGGSLNVSIPTKRARTASRRVISPFGVGMSGGIQVPTKTDASSGDTSSFQEDQGTMHRGLLITNSLEVESVGDFEKHLPFDSIDVSTRHKKKKKSNHLDAAYEPRWHVDSSFQNEQRDHLKKSYQLEYNGSSGLLGQPVSKKPKTMRHSQDNLFDNITSIGGSVPSPVASQMSNMSNPNKFIKMLGGRDRGRKPKALKMLAGQLGSGSPWTLFEDQALVVLAHDMGSNWELVSDAINSTLQLKCIFRKAKECKERHHFLMDRTSGDGADSAEDSGSSQPYPSTLPGIPRGSARQLFQRLQGPMEEDTLKSHFEKIIIIGQKQHYRKSQDPKQIQPPHSSHTIALSHVCPNNLNGGPVLTPLDLCDATIAGPDMLSLGYQGPHPGGLAIPNQGTVTPMHPSSGATSGLQGSPNMMLGNNFSSSPGSINSSARDGRYALPRSASVSTEEQQRMQHYNQMISGRNIPQPNISAPGALPGSERRVRILPGGSGMGLVCGINRGMPMARPGFQGIASATTMNSGGMVSAGMSSTNMNSGVGSGQGSSTLRPHEALHMMRPGLIQDSQRQLVMPDLQMQVSPRNSQVSHFGGLSSPYPNQTTSPPVSSHSLHQQPSHPISPQQPHFQGPANHSTTNQQQAYAIHLAKERQQHRFLQQQSQQQLQQPHFSASSSSMPHVQSQLQLPVPSPVQNSSQLQPQTGSPPVSLSPLASVSSTNSIPQHQQKHQPPTQGAVRTQAGGSAGKQRQRQQQQFSQASRQHPQQRQQSQAQQPAKVAKGVGRGNAMMHQNIPIDPSLVNGASPNPGNQCSEKGEASTHLMQNQGLYSGSVLNAVQSTRQHIPSQSLNQSLPQQKIYSGQAASSTKHLHRMNFHSDNNSSGHVSAVAPGLSVGHQSVANSDLQPAPSHQKLGNPNQVALQRAVQPNRQINSSQSSKPQARDSNADQKPMRSSVEMDTITTLHPVTSDATNVVNVVSSTPAHQLHSSEPLLDPNATNLGSMMAMTSNSSESKPHVSQGGGQRPPSASLPLSRHDVSARQEQPSQLQQPNLSVTLPQQHQQPLPPLHSQQQAHLLQAGNGNSYGGSGDHKLD